jgi:hypothetical protein
MFTVQLASGSCWPAPKREEEEEGLSKGGGLFRKGACIFALEFANERILLFLMRGVVCCLSDPSFGIE